jgi:plastocyanin
VPVGTQVNWIFEGSLPHNVSSDDHDFASSPDRQRGQYTVTFDEAGSYPYECSLHAGLMSDYRIVVSQ